MCKKHEKRFFIKKAIVRELRFSADLFAQHKQQMQMVFRYRDLETALYLAKHQRYIQNQTAVPVFQEQTRTDLVQVSQVDSQVTSLSSLLLQSSFKHMYERVLAQCSKTILTQSPQSAEEWYYATGGVIPYGR